MRIGLDLDGTLLDTFARHKEVLRSRSLELGVVQTDDFFEEFIRQKRRGTSTLGFLTQHEVADAETIAEAWIETIEHPEYLELDRLYPRVMQLLASLRSAGHDLILCTARKNDRGVVQTLETLQIDSWFERVYIVPAGRHAGLAKAKATRDCSLDAIVGDTETDHGWAAALSVCFAAVSWGFRDAAFWDARNVRSHDTLAVALQVALQPRS